MTLIIVMTFSQTPILFVFALRCKIFINYKCSVSSIQHNCKIHTQSAMCLIGENNLIHERMSLAGTVSHGLQIQSRTIR